jgi:hypothetical protein
MAVRRVGVSCEAVPTSKDINMEADEVTALEAITRQQPVKMLQ